MKTDATVRRGGGKSPRAFLRWRRTLTRRRPSRVLQMSSSDLDRIAYFLLHRYFAMRAVRLMVRDLAERGKVSLRLKRAARALGLHDYIVAPEIGRPPAAVHLWKMRDATFETGIERAAFKRALTLARQAMELGLPAEPMPQPSRALRRLAKLGLNVLDLPEHIGFSFCRKGAAGPVLRGHAGKVDDSRAELVLAGSPEWTTAYTEGLCKAGITVESVQKEGVTHEQRWVEASGEIVPDGRKHGGRVPLRRPDLWQLLENNIVRVNNQLIQDSAFNTTALLEAAAQKGVAMIDAQRRKARVFAVLCELARLRGRARQREAKAKLAKALRREWDAWRSSQEEIDPKGRSRRDRRIANIRAENRVPKHSEVVAQTLREWGIYYRVPNPATLRRLRGDVSERDLHAKILRLHRLLVRAR